MKKILILLSFCAIHCLAEAQSLDYETRVTVILDDGTEVILFGEAFSSAATTFSKAKGDKYFYVPPTNTLKISKNSTTQKASFSFLKYETNLKTEPIGGAMLATLEFGLTSKQEQELTQKLRKKIKRPRARVMGSVQLMPEVGKNTGTFDILILKSGKESTLQQSKAPIGQGGKMQIIANLDQYDTQIFENLIRSNSPQKGVFFDLRYTYPIMVSGFTASMEFNETRYHEVRNSINRKYENRKDKGPWGWGVLTNKESATKEEFRDFYETMRDSSVITQTSKAGMFSNPETTKELETAFFNFFFTSFARPESLKSAKGERQDTSGIPTMSSREEDYELVITDKTISDLKKRSSFQFNHRVPHRFGCSISANIGDLFKNLDFEEYIRKVRFDDPLFAHREINIMLDAELSDLVGEVVNSVEVKLRKKRQDGAYYYFDNQPPVIFRTKEEGHQLRTYNLSHDKSQKVYEYKVKINYRGGKSEQSNWRKGNWSQIVITPKMIRRDIEFEADLDDLRDNNITRVTLQVRYIQLGREKTDNVNITVSREEAGLLKTIFMDSDKKAYATRVIYNHKELSEKVILPWREIAFSDDYVYASIPESLRGLGTSSFSDFIDEHDFDINDSRDIQNSDGTLKSEVREEGADIFDEDF